MKFPRSMMIVAIALCSLGGCTTTPSDPEPAVLSKESLPRDPSIGAYVRTIRSELSDGKVLLINNIMNLTPQEAAVFWPIYQEYESKLFDLGDQRVELIRRFGTIQQANNIAPADAKNLSERYFTLKKEEIDLQNKYCDLISNEMSPVRGAQFTQIEHRVGTVVDLTIASKLPLLVVYPATRLP